MTKRELVAVEWHDAHADAISDWTEIDSIDPDPYRVITVGVNLGPVKINHISVALSIGHGVVGQVMHIPERMVKELTVLGIIDTEH